MRKSEKGFSVIEILVVVLVIGLIGGAIWYVLQPKAASPQADNSVKTLNLYKISSNSAPDTGQKVDSQLIKDEATFDQVWVQLYKDNQPPPKPDINFKANSLILVTYPASSGGNSVAIDKVTQTPDTLSVDYTVNKPGNNCSVTNSLVLDYALAAIPLTSKDATFSSSEKTYDC
jgi:type II secretory pathway pseudopilin PulG